MMAVPAFRMPALRMTLALAATAAAAGLGAATGNPSRPTAAQPPSTEKAATTITFGFLPDPDFGPGYTTGGSYPQVYGAADFSAVNAALKQTVLAGEAQTRQTFAALFPNVGQHQTDQGLFATYPRQGVLYAGPNVVSVLIPLEAVPPGGNDGGSWLAETALVPSGRSVQITDLLARPDDALPVLRTLVGDGVIVSSSCTTTGLVQMNGSVTAPISGLTPTADTFARFALSPYGLTFGFQQGTFSAEACGSATATVDWAALSPMLSPLGTEIEKDVTP